MLGNTHNTHNTTGAPVYDTAGNPVNPQEHHNTSSGGGIASKIPGTEAHAEKKAYEQGAPAANTGYSGTGTNQGFASTGTGPGYSSTGTGSEYGTGSGYGTSGSVAPDSHVGGTNYNATHSSTGTGGGIASKIPGTAAHDQTHPHGTQGAHTGAGYGTTGTGVYADSHVGGHHNTTHSSTGTGGGIASKIPGTKEHEATHPTHHDTTTGTTHGTHGTHDVHDTTTGSTHGTHNVRDTTTHGYHAAGTEHTKPSMADKIGGKIDVLVGKATKNDAKVAEGEIKQTEGKAGLAQNQGLATGPGHHTSGTGPTY